MKPKLSAKDSQGLRGIQRTAHTGWSLDDWVLLHYSIYGGNDRSRSATELWLQVVTEGARLAEDVRRGRITKAFDDDLVDLFRWLCAFVAKYLHQPRLNARDPIRSLRDEGQGAARLPGPESFAKWILQKYPRVCCACGRRQCACSSHRGLFEGRREKQHGAGEARLLDRGTALRQEALKAYARSKRRRERFYRLPLDKVIDMFAFIYGGGHEGVDLWQIAAHLLEEIGEVADELAFLSELHELKRLMKQARPPVKFSDVVDKAFRLEGGLKELEKEADRMREGGEDKIIDRLRAKSIQALRGELADVLSWVSAMVYKIRTIMQEVRADHGERYLFTDRLGNRYRRNGAFVCFACGAVPCENDCRAVWYVRKVLDDRKQELRSQKRVTAAGSRKSRHG